MQFLPLRLYFFRELGELNEDREYVVKLICYREQRVNMQENKGMRTPLGDSRYFSPCTNSAYLHLSSMDKSFSKYHFQLENSSFPENEL